MLRFLSHRHLLLTLLFTIGLHAISAPSASADSIMSGAVAGVGGIGNPVTGDADTMEWNPAALGESKYTFQFLVTPVSARLASDEFAIEAMIRLLNGTASPSDKQQLLAGLQGDELVAKANLNSGAYITLGGNGLGATVRSYAQGKLTADGAEILLVGGKPGKEYQLAGTQSTSTAFGDVRIAGVYSDPWLAQVLHITGFHMGGTLRYLQGLQYGWAQVSGATAKLVPDGEGGYQTVGDARLSSWQSQTGWGLATDLGLLIRVTPSVAVDASIVDLGQTWWHDVVQTDYEYQLDQTTQLGAFQSVRVTPTGVRPTWQLPTKFQTGVSISDNNGFVWSARYVKQLAGPDAGQQEWLLATQLDRWNVLPIRLAAKYNTTDTNLQFAFGFGLHLGPLVLDIGTPNLTGLLNRSKDASVSISTGLRF